MSSKPGFGSSVDLETIDSDRPIRKDTLEVKNTDVETGWRAFVSVVSIRVVLSTGSYVPSRRNIQLLTISPRVGLNTALVPFEQK